MIYTSYTPNDWVFGLSVNRPYYIKTGRSMTFYNWEVALHLGPYTLAYEYVRKSKPVKNPGKPNGD